MPYVVIESLKHGLDGRKLSLSSVPGTLEIAENVHVNEGGEVQKRKAFVVDVNKFPVRTFGLQPTDTGLEVYGSDAAPGGLPTGITYVRLQHPTVSDGGAYDATYHAMTKVIMSDNYNGKAFVVAEFSDGRTFLYYNSLLIDQSRWGLVMEGDTSFHALGLKLAVNVNKINGWTGIANINANLQPSDGSVLVYSPSGVSYDPTITYQSVAGILASFQVGTDGAGTALTRASTFFTISGSISAGATVTITGPSTPSAGDTVTIGSVVFQAGDTLTTFTARLVTAINGGVNYGYSAESTVGVIAIVAPATWDGFQGNGVQITATYAVCTVTAAGSINLIASVILNTTFMAGTINDPNPAGLLVSTPDLVKCTPKGGTPPYTFLWTHVSGDDMTITDPTVGATLFEATLAVFETRQAKFKCTVKDTLTMNIDSSLVTVRLYHGQ